MKIQMMGRFYLMVLTIGIMTTGCNIGLNVNSETCITSVSLTVTEPVTGARPATAADFSYTGNFTIENVYWYPDDNPFEGGMIYYVSVTLRANEGYTFLGIDNSNININNSYISSGSDMNPRETITIGRYFPRTAW
jgi:hypothetical protein